MLVTVLKTIDSSTQLHTLANVSQVHLIICLVAYYCAVPHNWKSNTATCRFFSLP